MATSQILLHIRKDVEVGWGGRNPVNRVFEATIRNHGLVFAIFVFIFTKLLVIMTIFTKIMWVSVLLAIHRR